MQQHSPPILLDALSIAPRFEVNGYRINAVYLLVGIAATITDGDHEHQQIWPLFGNLRKDLDEV
ncbi:hypothetical protein, partial [Pseudomonas aeruginosa]|uniref:hypothetical protein n=1 Tax=Pseudomonas aeruginosa TaxID=287 RepID=UPI0031B72095